MNLTDTFYHEYKDTVLNLAQNYFSNPDDADEAAQECFVKLMTVRGTIPEDKDEAAAWVYRVVDNFLKDLWRKEVTRRKRQRGLECEAEEAIDFDDPLSYNEREEAAQLFMHHYENLDEPYRTTFLMRYEEGYSYEIIAEKTGVAVGTVSSRIARAKEMVLA